MNILNILLIFYGILIVQLPSTESNHKFPGVIELVGYNSRHARMPKDLRTTYVQPPMKKQRADIETVKQNIEEYNKLLKIDTKKLSDQQKDMLERIVERVARLKETFEIDAAAANAAATSTLTTLNTTPKLQPDDDISTTSLDDNSDNLSTIDDLDSTSIKFINDETTYLPLNTENDPATLTTIQEEPTDEARANTKIDTNEMKLSTISGIRIGTTITNKLKNRQSTTKRPTSMSVTKSTSNKRIITTSSGHHYNSRQPSVKPTYSSMPSSVSPVVVTSTASTQQPSSTIDFNSITTIQPQNFNKIPVQHFKQPLSELSTSDVADAENLSSDELNGSSELQKTVLNVDPEIVQPVVQIQQRTPINAGGIISSDLIYDANVTATSIIDSLSNHAREDYYNNKGSSTDTSKDKKPSASGTAKPTKYHYYPHNQHIYLLPECAIQQVCNAVYVRLNYTQPLCACPSRYRDPCSASLNEDDQHTTKLIGDGKKKAITLAKTCEATTEMRECRSPKDWSLLALQNTRTGKSHYLVICRCPDHFKLEGPMAHDQPTYASVPGIRVFGMMCVKPGYAVRKPSIQPPKRYQLQKPYYISNSNKYGLNKDRPISQLGSSSNGYQQQQQQQQTQHQQLDSYQLQHQANYQYLNRPESSPIINSASHTEYPDSISINTFSNGGGGGGGGGSGYGRNNERKGEIPIEAVAEEKNNHDNDDSNNNENQPTIDTNNNNNNINNKREKRSIIYDNNNPEFPWDKLVEFQQSVVWDD